MRILRYGIKEKEMRGWREKKGGDEIGRWEGTERREGKKREEGIERREGMGMGSHHMSRNNDSSHSLLICYTIPSQCISIYHVTL